MANATLENGIKVTGRIRLSVRELALLLLRIRFSLPGNMPRGDRYLVMSSVAQYLTNVYSGGSVSHTTLLGPILRDVYREEKTKGRERCLLAREDLV